jgi:hypothetical protein
MPRELGSDSAQKLEAITLVWMMAPKLSLGAWLGRHHPYVFPPTIPGLIRTTTRRTLCVRMAALLLPCVMAMRNIRVAMKVTG